MIERLYVVVFSLVFFSWNAGWKSICICLVDGDNGGGIGVYVMTFMMSDYQSDVHGNLTRRNVFG